MSRRPRVLPVFLALALATALPLAHGGIRETVEPDVLEILGMEVLVSDLQAPTDVAIADDGTVYVLVGYDGRIVALGPEGVASFREIPGRPVGMGWGAGRLWIPRTDSPSIWVLDPATGDMVERPIDGAPADTRTTDAVVDGERVIVVANEGGPWAAPVDGGAFELLEVDLAEGTPFLAATSGSNQFVVTDVRQDRVLAVDLRKDRTDFVGRWGVWEGTFVHPTGVAVDRRGRIFVADGYLGVVQAFDEDGAFLGALGRDGELLRLEHPMGLAVDGDHLVVADRQSGRVLRFELDDRTSPITPQGMYDRKVPRLSYIQGDEDPKAVMTTTCESCHDGSIRPSSAVWDDQYQHHPVDTVPRKPIPYPFTVDTDGKLYCGSCHIPHRMNVTAGAPDGDLEVFLKGPRARSELCLACHTDVVAEVRQLAGPTPTGEDGHLVGDVPLTVPRHGPAAISQKASSVECLDCHAPHRAVGESLLSIEAAASGGCARCHVGVAVERGANTHPVDRALTDKDAVRTLKAKEVFLGPGDSVACLTCHDVHRSNEADALTARMSADERCVVCHREQASLRAGGHDLRKGADGHVATACLACHTIHDATGPALGRMGGDLHDPTGCQTCHGRGGTAKTHIDPAGGHPLFEANPNPALLPSVAAAGSMQPGAAGNSGCLTCHDPHARSAGDANPSMLRRPGGDAGTCLACHPDQFPALDSDHDLRRTDSSLARKLGDTMDTGGFCLACHGMHDGSDWQGWNGRVGGPASESMATRSCLGCHEPGNPAGGTVVQAWDHPTELLLTSAKVPWQNTGELPLYDDRGRPTDDKQIGQITCLTCHDPHVWSPKRGGKGGAGDGDTNNSFLRPDWRGFCAGCHGEEALEFYRYYHDPGHRQELQKRNERRDWPLYQQEDP